MADYSFTIGADGTVTAPETGAGTGIGSGLTDPDGNPQGENTDYCGAGKKLLLEEFKNKPRMEAFLCKLLDQVTQVEAALWDLFTLRGLEEATGTQLDGIGTIVGEPRRGRLDDIYRVFLRVRIMVNASDGKIEQLYDIVRTALGEDSIVRIQTGNTRITVNVDSDIDPIAPIDLMLILREAKGGGIAIQLVYTFSPDASTLTFDDDTTPGPEDNAQGLGSTTDASWGGDIASVIR